MIEYSVQMYSLRDMTGKDLAGALKKVADIGYKYVEFAGFFGHKAEDVRAMLDEYGLKVSSTHTNLREFDADFAETVKFHHIIGNTNIVTPGEDGRTKEALDATIDKMNLYIPQLASEGITLGYHNHEGEFWVNQDGLVPHTEFEKRTNIEFEIDTYWAFCAGLDPVETIERLKDRIRVIHIKDGTRDYVGKALGEGEAPVVAVWKKAVELGIRMVVESEGCNPTGAEEVERCFKFLSSLE